MKGGKFDHPTRMFMSIRDCWLNCLTNPSDVKELIPEFFYQAEFLENKNQFVFGYYNDIKVDCDIELPVWANGDVYKFLSIHSKALESEYVSANLNHWIDLIFGYKQRGKEAEDAHNIFFYTTYEGSIELDAIEDPVERSSIESQIINFGQTPSQLFTKPHPSRLTLNELKIKQNSSNSSSATGVAGLGNSLVVNNSKIPIAPYYDLFPQKISKPIIFLEYTWDNKLVIITIDGLILINNLLIKYEKNQIFQFEMDKSVSNVKAQKRIDMILPESVGFPSRYFVVSGNPNYNNSKISSTNSGNNNHVGSICNKININGSNNNNNTSTSNKENQNKLLLSSAMWSDDIQARSLINTNFKKIDEVEHRDLVSCITMCEDGKTLISASKDCTIIIWNINNYSSSSTGSTLSSLWGKQRKSTPVFKVKQILYGHTDAITTVDASIDLDIVVSGSKDNTIILYSLCKGKYIKSIQHSNAISQVRLSRDGYFAAYIASTSQLYLYSINGNLIARKQEIIPRLFSMIFTPDSKYFITAGASENIIVRSVPDLTIVYVFETGCSVLSMEFISTPDISFLLAGLVNGQIRMFHFDPARFLSSS